MKQPHYVFHGSKMWLSREMARDYLVVKLGRGLFGIWKLREKPKHEMSLPRWDGVN